MIASAPQGLRLSRTSIELNMPTSKCLMSDALSAGYRLPLHLKPQWWRAFVERCQSGKLVSAAGYGQKNKVFQSWRNPRSPS